MGNLAGWPYWKVISITGQSGAGTDYQVKLTIGDSAGGDFHLEGHCTNFPQDIRITDDDGTTLLDHFVEDLTADPIVVHVEVKDDLGSNRDIRVYYGKSGETTASNGANTFLQYHGSATADFHDANVVSVPFIFEASVRRTADSSQVNFGLSEVQYVYGDDSAIIYCGDNQINTNGRVYNNGATSHGFDSIVWTLNTFHKIKIVAKSSSDVDFYLKDSVSADVNLTTNIPDEAMGLVMYEFAGSGEQEWSFVRKYNSPEPAFNSAGAEQTPPVTGHLWYYRRNQ